jgi:hypothetical protein
VTPTPFRPRTTGRVIRNRRRSSCPLSRREVGCFGRSLASRHWESIDRPLPASDRACRDRVVAAACNRRDGRTALVATVWLRPLDGEGGPRACNEPNGVACPKFTSLTGVSSPNVSSFRFVARWALAGTRFLPRRRRVLTAATAASRSSRKPTWEASRAGWHRTAQPPPPCIGSAGSSRRRLHAVSQRLHPTPRSSRVGSHSVRRACCRCPQRETDSFIEGAWWRMRERWISCSVCPSAKRVAHVCVGHLQ